MKWILPILLLAFVSCKQSQVATNQLESDIKIDSTLITNLDTLQIDTTTTKEVINNEIVSEMIILRRNDARGADIITQTKLITAHEKKTNLSVIDKTTNQSLDTNWGWISYSVPQQMKVQKSYSIKVRISKKTSGQNKAILILGESDAINNSEYPTTATIEDIRVSGEMSAELRGDSEWFNIVALSTNTQDIDTQSYTEWEWVVVPKKGGQSPLKLVIKVKNLNKDIIVFNKNIGIKSNIPVSIEGFFDKYWQWLMTTIIIPIFLYFWNKKKKRTKK